MKRYPRPGTRNYLRYRSRYCREVSPSKYPNIEAWRKAALEYEGRVKSLADLASKATEVNANLMNAIGLPLLRDVKLASSMVSEPVFHFEAPKINE